MKPFDYYEATTVPEALDLLASGEDVRVLAGGCGILEMMKQNLYAPLALVNIKKIESLKFIRPVNGCIQIGTLSTHTDVKESSVVRQRLPILSEALGFVATTRIRNMATLGGTIVHADPNSDVAPSLLVLEASVKVAAPGGEKELPIETVYRDYFETNIEPGELVESVTIPVPAASARGVYMRFQVRKAMDKAMPGVAALVQLDEDRKTIRWARIAMSGVGAIPLRFHEEEAFLVGNEFAPEIAETLARMVEARVEPVAEHHYSTEYKKVLAGIMTRRAVAEAIRRAVSASS